MNYLAHVYLSGDNIDIAIGNFISDCVKGNRYKSYPVKWQEGILLHRFIDTYTDSHEIFKNHSRLFFDSEKLKPEKNIITANERTFNSFIMFYMVPYL